MDAIHPFLQKRHRSAFAARGIAFYARRGELTYVLHYVLRCSFTSALLVATTGVHGVALNHAARAQIERIVTSQIATGNIPGAVIMIGNADRISYAKAFGLRVTGANPEPMTLDTVFDIASLTKVVATTTASMQLIESGRLQLDAPVASYWPAFAANGKARVTVRELLAHTSGLRPGLRPLPRPSTPARVMREVATQVLHVPRNTRVIYSDLNFAALSEIIQRITGESLDHYCQTHLFDPLAMHDTGFLPDNAHASRSAATTPDHQGMRRGRVHDPFANAMGGVSGNAGLFSTAPDLARFAQMLLNDGRIGNASVLQASSVALLGTATPPIATPPMPPLRSLGWAREAPLAANRDRLAPVGMLHHTGFTGTAIWIDLVSKTFVVVLTNRVHPNNRGDATPIRQQVIALVASQTPEIQNSDIEALLPYTAPVMALEAALPVSAGPVKTGIDILEAQQFHPLQGMRIALITNRSGFNAQGKRTIDILKQAPGVTLATLFAPEHGLNTDRDTLLGDTHDAATGLTVHSLYGKHRHFDDAALEGLDALVFDVQDAGVRFFTYETTLGYALQAAARRGIPLFVLDRPNPLGANRFGGPILDTGRESFTGFFPLPLQSGMTIGEIALLFNRERLIEADVRVIPMTGYRRAMRLADTGVGWVPLSPNLRTPDQLDLYPDVALLERANVSVGRGTPHPFEWLGAPWIDGARLAGALNALDTGVRFESIDFVPTESTYRGQLCHGVRVASRETHSAARRPARLGLALLSVLFAQYPDTFHLSATRDAVGSEAIWQAIHDGADRAWVEMLETEQLTRFAPLRANYLLYKD